MGSDGSFLAGTDIPGAGPGPGPSQSPGNSGPAQGESATTLNIDTPETAAAAGLAATALRDAALLAAGYDYDGAIALLNETPGISGTVEVRAKIEEYEQIKTTLVRVNPVTVTHVFFHSLVMDNALAFDGDSREKGYNQVMTTKSEFMKIIQSMYDRGYVLVRLHDLAYEVKDADGGVSFKGGDVMLPPGKTAFVMSQDDVCYYDYMKGDGFATRMVVGDDGKPTCEMELADGSVVTGAYDLVPLLEEFIESHPDFSYRGARAVIAFTGYEGILGYRTATSYSDSPTYASDRKEAARVAQALRDAGWELASHSWGHLNMGAISYEKFKTDTDKWESEVESLIGPTDIILFPFGSDIGDWKPYTHENERYDYLYRQGFRYFCNVDSSVNWVQLGKDSYRQGRRNLDGYRMYYDIIQPDLTKRKTEDLFHAEDVFDPDRPTPVPPM
ncbi:MAG: polysaccharide deacetylase family protein [Lachnospiraceae bacterium]|nr:polysaccharide deacetylase family protein [Lachnospiraceae bacterium]